VPSIHGDKIIGCIERAYPHEYKDEAEKYYEKAATSRMSQISASVIKTTTTTIVKRSTEYC
jgi:hypothetical protein